MKRILAVLLSMMLMLSGCSAASMENSSDESRISDKKNTSSESMVDQKENSNEKILSEPKNLSFGGLDDESLLTYAKGSIYSDLVANLNSDEYFVENVDAVYISQEYINESTYNSESNLYFGYNLADLDKQFQGQRYIFTCGDDGTTVAQKMETLYDNTTEQIIKNVAMGGGVILVCVTVSVVSAGAGAPAVCMIFATAAQTGTTFALSSSVISGAAATITTAYQTHDFEEAFKQGALAASEGFKWGAISGAAIGGASSTYALHGATLNGLSMNEAAAIQMESGYPLDVIKQFKSIEEYDVYRKAGLKASQVGNKSALVRKIDLDYVTEIDGVKLTNRELMEKGLAPFDPATGKRYQLHHVNQDPNGTLAILKEAEHQGNSSILNTSVVDSRINRPAFKKIREQFWKDYVAQCL